MQNKYSSSITGEVKFFIVSFLSFWMFMTLVSIDSNGIGSTVSLSIFLFVFVTVLSYALVKYTYLTVDNNKVKYVHTFVQREELEINQIKKIQKGIIGGLFKFLLLTYEIHGKTKQMKISPLTFKKETLKQFILELKRKNPQIDLDQSVNVSID